MFEQGYETLKRATRDFRELSPDQVLRRVYACPIAFIVLRTMLGFTPAGMGLCDRAADGDVRCRKGRCAASIARSEWTR